MELLADRDPEEARQLLDPVLERMMEAVHHYEGTVNQVMGDGIMALFGAPLAHEDHAVRACYAALRMQERVGRYADEVQRTHGVPVQMRVGLNSGDVVVRSIGNDLHMDYTAVGQTTHLAARMEQMARPGSTLLTPATLRLVEGFVRVSVARDRCRSRDSREPVEVFELLGRRFQPDATPGVGHPGPDALHRAGRRARSSCAARSSARGAGARPGRRRRRRARRRQVPPGAGSSRIRTGRRGGSSSSPAPSPTARRRRSCRSGADARRTSGSRIGTTRGACARS